ncbi:MAG: flagellar hook-length control protein FliK [Planctomycetales bacterium]|nr:flagellar hook-length control protein FliK [Planctomycetales bacterium]
MDGSTANLLDSSDALAMGNLGTEATVAVGSISGQLSAAIQESQADSTELNVTDVVDAIASGEVYSSAIMMQLTTGQLDSSVAATLVDVDASKLEATKAVADGDSEEPTADLDSDLDDDALNLANSSDLQSDSLIASIANVQPNIVGLSNDSSASFDSGESVIVTAGDLDSSSAGSEVASQSEAILVQNVAGTSSETSITSTNTTINLPKPQQVVNSVVAPKNANDVDAGLSVPPFDKSPASLDQIGRQDQTVSSTPVQETPQAITILQAAQSGSTILNSSVDESILPNADRLLAQTQGNATTGHADSPSDKSDSLSPGADIADDQQPANVSVVSDVGVASVTQQQVPAANLAADNVALDESAQSVKPTTSSADETAQTRLETSDIATATVNSTLSQIESTDSAQQPYRSESAAAVASAMNPQSNISGVDENTRQVDETEMADEASNDGTVETEFPGSPGVSETSDRKTNVEREFGDGGSDQVQQMATDHQRPDSTLDVVRTESNHGNWMDGRTALDQYLQRQASSDDQVIHSLSLEEFAGDMSSPAAIKKSGQVIRDAMASSLRLDGRTVEVELHPAELGNLRIQVTQHEHSIEARIVTTEFTTSELLIGQRDMLMDTLSDLGFESSDVHIFHDEQSSGESSKREGSDDFSYQTKTKAAAPVSRESVSVGGVNIVA